MRRFHVALLSLLAVTLLVVGASAQEPAEGGPKIMMPESVIDLGTVVQGEVVETTFKVVNEGDQPLEIKAVRPTCACTVSEFDKEIPPGGEGAIRVKLDTNGLRGPVAKSLLIYNSDPATPNKVAVLKATVETYVDVLPRPLVRFNTVEGIEARDKVVLVGSGDRDFKVTEAKASVPFIDVAVRKLEGSELIAGRPEPQYEIETTLNDRAKPGPMNAQIVVTTSHPQAKEVEIEAFGVVRALIHVTPPELQFGPVEASITPARNILVINNRPDKAVAISKAEVDDPAFSTEIITIESGRRYQVTVTIKGDAAAGQRNATLTLTTDDPDAPKLEIPVAAVIR